MGKFFEDIKKGLEEVIEIEKENISLKEKVGMPAPTFFVENNNESEENKINE